MNGNPRPCLSGGLQLGVVSSSQAQPPASIETQTRPARPRVVPGARRNLVPGAALGGRTHFGLVGEATQCAHTLVQKTNNWLAFVQFACASILCDMTVFG